jgi:hypothetical protein
LNARKLVVLFCLIFASHSSTRIVANDTAAPPSTPQKAKDQLKLADEARLRKWVNLPKNQRTPAIGDAIRAGYAAVLEIPDADKESRKRAQSYIGYVWHEQGEFLKGAQAFETLSNWPELEKYEQLDALRSAIYVLGDNPKPKADASTVQLLERVYPRMLKLETQPEKIAAMQLRRGDLLLAYGNKARAYEVWASLADDKTAAHEDRAQAIEKIAAERLAEKKPQLALAAWQRTASWPAPPIAPKAKDQIAIVNWAHRRAQSRAEAYFALKDEAKLRDELAGLVAIAKNNPAVMWHARFNSGASYAREASALRKANPNASTQIKAQIAAKEKDAAVHFEAVLNADEVPHETRYQAALERAQSEVDSKNYVKARGWLLLASEKLKSKDQLFGPKNSYVLPLMKAVAKIGYAEKNYKDAVDALLSGLSYANKPDTEGTQMVFELWNAAMKDQQWEQARHILNRMKAYDLPAADYYPALADLEAKAQNWKAAADAVVRAENLTLNETQKKTLADALAKIPADVMTKARTDFAATKTTPAPAPAPSTGGGFGWWF